MENFNYFIPEPEDFRVGYECEADIYTLLPSGEMGRKTWTPYVFKGADFLVPQHHLNEYIRTMYLTREKIDLEIPDTDSLEITYSGYPMCELVIAKRVDKLWYVLFNGECKDINTLRLIAKLIGVSS